MVGNKKTLMAGHVRSGPRQGDMWVGVQGDDSAYDQLRSVAGGPSTHILVIGGVEECLTLIRVLAETLLDDAPRLHVVAGMERIIEELDVIETEANNE